MGKSILLLPSIKPYLCTLICVLLLGILLPTHQVHAISWAPAGISNGTDTTQENLSVVAPVGPDQLTATLVEELVGKADLIVRGQVVGSQSIWRAGERQIETLTTVAVGYTIAGENAATIQVRTPGGFLPEMGLGMVSYHTATFSLGEEVLLFLHQESVPQELRARQQWGATESQSPSIPWQLVNGASGKFIVDKEHTINQDGMVVTSFAGLLPEIAQAKSRDNRNDSGFVQRVLRDVYTQDAHAVKGQELDLADVAQSRQMTAQHTRRWATPHAGVIFTINLNTAQLDEKSAGKRSTEFRDAIIAAAQQWSDVPSADFVLRYGGTTAATVTGYNGSSEILFMHKGTKERAAAAEVWYRADGTIVEADIWINDDYRWNADGHPAPHEVDLESALVHEFGHWLILGHLAEPRSIMYPRLSAGSIKRQLQPEDMAGIAAIYPR